MNKQISEKDYRGLPMPSYSLLKELDKSGPRVLHPDYTRKFSSEALEFGDLVDTMLLQPEELDNKFYFESVKKPTGQLKILADYIIENYDAATYDNDDILKISYDLDIFGRRKDDTRISTFDTDIFWDYITASYNAYGKTVFSPETYSDAERAIDTLLTHKKSRHVFKLEPHEEGINQLKLVFTYRGVELKCMMDRVVINHEARTVQMYDLKCTDVRQKSFPYIFNKLRYSLQAYLYHVALGMYVEKMFNGYVLLNPLYLVYSRADRYPFTWRVSDNTLEEAKEGIVDGAKVIKGIDVLVDDYKYYVTAKVFNIEREFIENTYLPI